MSHLEPNKLLEEAQRLLPWYLTDKLSKAEQGLVNQALELFPELQPELLQEEKMMRVVRTNTSLLELSALDTTEQRLNKLLARIDREDEKLEETATLLQEPALTDPVMPAILAKPKANAASQAKKKWFDLFWRDPLPFFNLNWLTPANAVFASLLIAQCALLAYQVSTPATGNKFTVASVETNTPQPVNTDGKTEVSRFLVQFANQAKHQEICDFLNQWHAHIVAGPNAQSIFTIEMPVAPNTDKVALADNIMKQTAQKSSPVMFLGPQFQDNTTQ